MTQNGEFKKVRGIWRNLLKGKQYKIKEKESEVICGVEGLKRENNAKREIRLKSERERKNIKGKKTEHGKDWKTLNGKRGETERMEGGKMAERTERRKMRERMKKRKMNK